MESFGFLSDNGQGFLNDIGMDPMESMDFLCEYNIFIGIITLAV